jgi:hypothetical protein
MAWLLVNISKSPICPFVFQEEVTKAFYSKECAITKETILVCEEEEEEEDVNQSWVTPMMGEKG